MSELSASSPPFQPRRTAARWLCGSKRRAIGGGAAALDRFRRESDNLYERVRRSFFCTRFTASICRIKPACRPGARAAGSAGADSPAPFHEAIDALLALSAGARPQLCRAPWPQPIKGSLSRRWRPSAPQRASGARQPVMSRIGHPPITRWFSGPNCSTGPRAWRISDPARIDPVAWTSATAAGAIFFSHGLPGRRARAQCLNRSGLARLRLAAPAAAIDVYLRRSTSRCCA